MHRSLLPFALLSAAALSACVADGTPVGSSEAASTTSASDAAVLALVDYPDTDDTLLDITIKLDSRAATNVIAVRNGPDGVYPSADDAPFTTFAALDAIPYVGSSALSKLRSYAASHPAPAGEVVETVSFSGWQSVAVVWGVNRATFAELDAFLDSRAAKALVAGRPFTTVAQMGPMAYVGPSALTALRGQALGWWNASKAPGFVLDVATLDDDAEMLKESLAEDEGFTEFLTQIAGDSGEGVTIIAALEKQIDLLVAPLVGTTYTDTDAAQAAVDTAAPVKNLTKEGQWSYLESIGVTPPTAFTCVASFETAVIPELGALLFMSESDRPFDAVAFQGAGATAPTAASVLTLVGAPPGSTSELRATADYYAAFEPSSSSADPSATSAVQAAFAAQLTDVVYVAVFAPPGSIDAALVDVYLVGRTTCGDLVGIHAVAVET